MTLFRKPLSWSALLCLLSVFLIAAGVSRYIETDSGNILIHDIDAESYEGFPYGARLFRPLQASSLNQRPSILLIPGNAGNRYTCDHMAMEFARRGFVALTMEDFFQGTTGPKPDFETENLVDAGYTFLATRSFTDHDRIGLITLYEGADKALQASSYELFTSAVFIAPETKSAAAADEDTEVYTAEYETDPQYKGIPDAAVFPASHIGMIYSPAVIGALLEHFHSKLAIPDDTPFWFEASSQSAQLLVGLRILLLLILMWGISALSGRILDGSGSLFRRMGSGILFPLLAFQAVSELMNFFLVSVRIGSPFHYLPDFPQIRAHFSLPFYLGLILLTLILSLPVKIRKQVFLCADLLAAAGILICLFGYLPILFSNRSGWETAGITGLKWHILLITVLSICGSLLFRMNNGKRDSRICNSLVCGNMFYLICCSLPAAGLFQEIL